MNTTAEVLRAARDRIDTPDKWWQADRGSDDADGRRTCMVLALDVAPFELRGAATAELALVIDPDSVDTWETVTDFNDARGRKHEEVLAVYDRAIEAASA